MARRQKFLTRILRAIEWQGGTSDLANKLQGSDDSECVLFIRMGVKGGSLCCGRCRLPSTDDATNTGSSAQALVELQLELIDWPELQTTTGFVGMALTIPMAADTDVKP